MSFPHTGGTANKKALGRAQQGSLAVIVDPKSGIGIPAFFVRLIQGPEDGPAGLSGAAQRSPTVCRSFNGSVGNGALCAHKFAKLLLWSDGHDCGLESRQRLWGCLQERMCRCCVHEVGSVKPQTCTEPL